MRERHVADVLQVLAARLRRIESRRRQVPVEGEELRGSPQIRGGAARIADPITDRALLPLVQLGEWPRAAMPRLAVQPGESLQHRLPVLLLLGIGGADPFVDE